MEVAAKRGKLQTEDLVSTTNSESSLLLFDIPYVFLVRKDRKKYTRVLELLRMNEELKRARKAFDIEEKA
jgi:transcription initiation factor TFIID subunit 13